MVLKVCYCDINSFSELCKFCVNYLACCYALSLAVVQSHDVLWEKKCASEWLKRVVCFIKLLNILWIITGKIEFIFYTYLPPKSRKHWMGLELLIRVR